MKSLDLELLLAASTAGGASCLTSVTELEPAAGSHASIAPAKFADSNSQNKMGLYAYESRYLAGEVKQAVIIDSKQSQLNRVEHELLQAISDGHETLARMPRIVVQYHREGTDLEVSDLTLPHRAFDGHIRAGTIDGGPVTATAAYREIRNSKPTNARALLDASPASLIFGSWDATRSSGQGRWRSILVGEIIGFCADSKPDTRGGARIDPVGMSIKLTPDAIKAMAAAQQAELSDSLYSRLTEPKTAKTAKTAKASLLGLGGIPPTLEALAGVACYRIIRSHVLSFAALRQLRFGAGPVGDTACRAVLAALGLNGLARADSELNLRANCDLRESAPTTVELDQRGGERRSLAPLSIAEADALLAQALTHAEQVADLQWNGISLRVVGNPAISEGATSDEPEGE